MENFEFNEKIVKWKLNNKDFSVKSEKIYMAYPDEINKTIVIDTGENFICSKKIICDFSGNLLGISNFSDNTVSVFFDTEKKHIKFKNLLDTGFFYNNNIILILSSVDKKNKKITALKNNGDYLYEILPPPGFSFYYFQENQNNIFVVCTADVAHQDEFGRSDFNFKIDLKTGYLVKEGLAY